MRQDILIDTTVGDVLFENKRQPIQLPFAWVEEADRYVRGQVTLPRDFNIWGLVMDGVQVHLPYTPLYKPIQVRLVREGGAGVVNAETGGEWFDVCAKLYGGALKFLCASELSLVNGLGNYVMQQEEGKMLVWSAELTDLRQGNANVQNRDLLLQCVPTNNYRYPLSGVGLVRYLHANLDASGLADVLQREFEADGVKVMNAAFDAEDGNLELDLDYSLADENI